MTMYFWVKQAQKDHDVFSGLMREEGVEVLDVNVLLAETLNTKAGRWPSCSTTGSTPTRLASA